METVLTSFANQKGGVAKSTLTRLMAVYIHYFTDRTVCVIDGDDKQASIYNMRIVDQKNGADVEKSFEVAKMLTTEFVDQYSKRLSGEFDYIFLDMPGSLKQPGVVASLIPVDIMFIPFNLSPDDMTATQLFVNEYRVVDEHRIKNNFPVAEKYYILSKIDRRAVKEEMIKEYRQASDHPVLENVFPHKPGKFIYDVTTYLEESKNVYDKDTKALCLEIFEKLEVIYNLKNKNV